MMLTVLDDSRMRPSRWAPQAADSSNASCHTRTSDQIGKEGGGASTGDGDECPRLWSLGMRTPPLRIRWSGRSWRREPRLPPPKPCHDRILEGVERRLGWGIREPGASIVEVRFPNVGAAHPRSDPRCREWDGRCGRPRRQAAADLIEQGGVRVGGGGGSRHGVRVGDGSLRERSCGSSLRRRCWEEKVWTKRAGVVGGGGTGDEGMGEEVALREGLASRGGSGAGSGLALRMEAPTCRRGLATEQGRKGLYIYIQWICDYFRKIVITYNIFQYDTIKLH
jgi:hypothetical protein